MSRFLTRAAVVAATTALAAGALVSAVAPAATAAATATIVEAAPYVDGQTVTVNFEGFPASTMVDVTVCKKAAVLAGPSDCASAPASSAFPTTAADGSGSASIQLIRGALGSTPAWTCGPGAGHQCDVVVTTFDGSVVAKSRIIYEAIITSVSPAGPYAGGETVTVSFTGAGASQSNPQVAAFQCDSDVPLGDGSMACDFGGLGFATVNASGAGTAQLTIKQGALGNALGSSCSNAAGSGCSIVVTDFEGRLLASVPLSYKTAAVKKAQTVKGVPTKVAKGKKKVLPRTTAQGFAIVYKSSTPKICKVVKVTVSGKSRRAVKGLKVGSCSLSLSANGNATYKALKTKRVIKVKR